MHALGLHRAGRYPRMLRLRGGDVTVTVPLCFLVPLLHRIRKAVKSEADGEKDAAGGPVENGKKGEAGAGDGSASQAPEGAAAGDAMEQEEEEEDDEEAAAAMMPIRGPLPPQDGSWASCIRLLDPVEGATVECLELGEGEAIIYFLSCNGTQHWLVHCP